MVAAEILIQEGVVADQPGPFGGLLRDMVVQHESGDDRPEK